MNNQLPPLVTIAIPTWNRATFLQLTLLQLESQLADLVCDFEILISDNASSDSTVEIVNDFLSRNLPIRYLRNQENIGSDHNIAQCFNQASGRYVLILGDDDLLVDGCLKRLEQLLEGADYGAVSFRAYGYDADFRAEHPGGIERLFLYHNPNDYLAKLGVNSTLISCNIISKQFLSTIDATQFCGSNLVQVDLIFSAALAAQYNLYIDDYLVACKRNNSGGYAFFEVFVDKFFGVLDKYIESGLTVNTIERISQEMLTGFYPYYAWKHRFLNDKNLDQSFNKLFIRFGNTWTFYVFIWPIFKFPRFLALSLGGFGMAFGRVLTGDLRRGIKFIFTKALIITRQFTLTKPY
jgi:abequosyltransferase